MEQPPCRTKTLETAIWGKQRVKLPYRLTVEPCYYFDMFGKRHKSAYELFREATSKRKSGDIANAIELLHEAKYGAEDENTIYTVEDYLRLPMYLQEAGRTDEAWKEFQILIGEGYPKQLNVNGLPYFDLATIYDKMRLFLQREGKPTYAVEFGVFSYACRLMAVRIQRDDESEVVAKMRMQEAEELISESNIRKMLKPLLKKANAEIHEKRLATVVKGILTPDDRINLAGLGLAVRKVIR